jgi:hypothetical protein
LCDQTASSHIPSHNRMHKRSHTVCRWNVPVHICNTTKATGTQQRWTNSHGPSCSVLFFMLILISVIPKTLGARATEVHIF